MLDRPLQPPVTGAGSSSPAAKAAELGAAFASQRADLAARPESGEDGLALGARNSAGLDILIRDLYAKVASSAPPGVALAAVGSHGRGAVALRSDADLRILVPSAVDEAAAVAFAEALFYPMWDAGISVGHQVMGQAEMLELAQHDLTAATALLDMRRLAGDEACVEDLIARAYAGLFAEEGLQEFVHRLEEETAARHERFGGSVYLLEPDVKSGAGGLRDLDGARWAARARFHVGDPGTPGANAWTDLVRVGVLVPREEREIAAAEEFLWRVRNRLHAHGGRRSDRLAFDGQETLALEMGYGNSDAQDSRSAAAESFMQDYYLHARVVTRSRERIFERASVFRRSHATPIARPELDLGGGVHALDGIVTIGGAAELAGDPALALRAYVAAVRENKSVHPYARSAIARAAGDPAWCAALRASTEAASAFVELVATVAEAKMRRASIVGELHDAGILLAMIPEFLPVTGRVHHDVYHVYTVDVHSVAAIDCLRALSRGEMATEHPLATRLAAEVQHPRPLFMATLLHDVGKGYPDATGSRKNHSQSGALLLDAILPRMGFSPEEILEARTLVSLHLSMYHVATRRDLDDPAAIEEFCRPIPGRETLRDLYLLTVADITTTSPTAMTSWKARMLEELYLAADDHLARTRGQAAEGGERSAQVRAQAAQLWTGPPAELSTFLASMPERYLLANGAADIVAHAMVSLARGSLPVHAAIVPSPQREYAELCVVAVAEDRPGLLARIAAVFTAARLEVFAAEVYSRVAKDGRTEAVDLFWVRDRIDGKDGVERRMPSVVSDLLDVCSDKITGKDLILARTGGGSKWSERPSPHVPTEVVVDDRASPRHTVVEVFAKDRPGLLYALAGALHDLGLSIALSKINTEGTRAADVFYVSELDGSKVRPGERFRQIKEAIQRAVVEA